MVTSLQVYVEPIDHSACSPDCNMSLRLVEDPRGYNISLTAISNDATLDAKHFSFSECLWTLSNTFLVWKNVVFGIMPIDVNT